MDVPDIVAQFNGKNESIKLLNMLDGSYQTRTYTGKDDVNGQQVDTYHDFDKAVDEFMVAAKVFLRIPPAR